MWRRVGIAHMYVGIPHVKEFPDSRSGEVLPPRPPEASAGREMPDSRGDATRHIVFLQPVGPILTGRGPPGAVPWGNSGIIPTVVGRFIWVKMRPSPGA